MNKKIILFIIVFTLSYINILYAVEPYFNTRLLEAASVGDAESVKDALHSGADVDARDRLGNTALILASDGGYQEVVRTLIAYKASVNAVNKFGYTPLMSAVTNSHRYIAALLIKAGADPKLANKFGTTPEMYIKAQGFFTMNEYISDENPVITSQVDKRPARRGAMAALHSAPWREEFNQLIALGKTNEAAELLVGYADSKNPEACYLLGTLFLSKGNMEQGLYWAKQAAALGDDMMKYRAAKSIIDNGNGVGMKDAVSMLKQSVADGNNFAKTEYAKALLFGNGVPKDNANAYALFKEASSYDIPEAVYYTGLLEYTGKGTVQDETKGSAKIQMAADMGFYEAEQFIDKLNAQKHMNLIVNSKVGDRATVKAYLISMGAIISIDDPQCDLYSLGNAWNNAYKISTVRICYPGDGTVKTDFIFGEAVENIELSYLKTLYPTALFALPRAIYEDSQKNNKDFKPTGADLGIYTDNKSISDNKSLNMNDNTSVIDNKTLNMNDNKSVIDNKTLNMNDNKSIIGNFSDNITSDNTSKLDNATSVDSAGKNSAVISNIKTEKSSK